MPHFSTDNPYIVRFDVLHCESGKLLSDLKIAVKDLFHIAGIATTAGNPDWLKSHDIPGHTSPVIETLQQHGAVVVGKTITDELAYSLNGQNIHYGTPLNPTNPRLLPGGSSSGSAVAVANGSADIGLGTDTGGSIRIPASYNGLFGLRPTHGVISTQNMVALAPSFDTVGWMTRDLPTLTAVADVLLPLPPKNNKQHDVAPGSALRLGFSSAINAACSHGYALVQRLDTIKQSAKAELLDVADWLNFTTLQQASAAFRILQGAEIWATHGDWIDKQKPDFADDIAARFAWCKTISSSEITQAQQTRSSFVDHLEVLFSQIDFLLIPTTPGCAPALDTPDSQLAEYRNTLLSMTCIAGLGGLPQLHIPFKLHHDDCLGVSLLGPRHQDHALLQLAHSHLEHLQ